MMTTLLTCIHGRPAVTRRFLRYYEGLAEDREDLDLLAVATEPMCWDSSGWHMLAHQNRPVSHKWQHGLEHAYLEGAEVVVVCGSDNFLTPSYFNWVEKTAQDKEYGYLCEQMLIQPYRQQAAWLSPFKCGSGRFVRRSLLERVDLKVWTGARNRGMDNQMSLALEQCLQGRARLRDLEKENIGHLHVKSGQNIWDFEEYMNPITSEGRGYVERHFPSLADWIFATDIHNT